MSKRKLPDHIPGTVEQWRRRKRREFRELMAAFETFRQGVAYTPAYVEIEREDGQPTRRHHRFNEVETTLEWMQEQLRGNWNP